MEALPPNVSEAQLVENLPISKQSNLCIVNVLILCLVVQRHLALPAHEYVSLFVKTFPHVKVRLASTLKTMT